MLHQNKRSVLQLIDSQHTSLLKQVPRAGVEPARVAPLVFETSASTDSAIWAFVDAKVGIFFDLAIFEWVLFGFRLFFCY